MDWQGRRRDFRHGCLLRRNQADTDPPKKPSKAVIWVA